MSTFIQLGIFLVLMIHPGDPRLGSNSTLLLETHKISAADTILDLVRNMFPDNIVSASFERSQTVQRTSATPMANGTVEEIRKEVSEQRGMNIIVCIGFGIVTSYYAEKVRVIVEFFVALDKIIMKLMLSVMWFAPLGITSLIGGSLLELDDIWLAAGAMSKYVLTILTGLLIHSFIIIPVLYFLLTRKNPIKIFKCMRQAGAAAMGTASSGAALPLSIKGMEEEGGVDERVTRFVLPLGANINMVHQVQLRVDQIVTISITATIASLGLNSVPAGLVSIILILSTVGLPSTELPLLFAVDWML
ncbi:transporter, dicarboxylate/amino acid:cation Na+/H+ symporter family protein [Cooperia oncophora]